MAIFKSVAVIRVVSPGGVLNTVMAESTSSDDIHSAMRQLLSEAIFETGDRIEIDEVETEIE